MAELPAAVNSAGLAARLALLRRRYVPLIKTLQTGLLLTTGLAGFGSARSPILHWQELLAMGASLFLAISGSTALNMWYDRDIDARMPRTASRPLPAGLITPRQALLFGITLSALGVGWALLLSPLYAGLVFAGLFIDVMIYTVWLKRRSAWSIVWGGVAGGMPILAGRSLALGAIDWLGLLLSLSVLLWIPTHILTFALRHIEEYRTAGVPTFPAVYGVRVTRLVIVASSLLAALAIAVAALGIGLTGGYLRILALLSAGLLALALGSLKQPSERANFRLFKFASLYMLGSMLLIFLGGF